MARQLYAEIASIEEQHVTQYESIIDPSETLAREVAAARGDRGLQLLQLPRSRRRTRGSRQIWERFLDYELGHLHFVMELFEQIEQRDPAEVLPATLPEPIDFTSQREFVREVLANEVDLRAQRHRVRRRATQEPARRRCATASS